MVLYKAQHTFQSNSDMSEDRYVNVFWINSTATPTDPVLQSWCAAVNNFYETQVAPDSTSISRYLSHTIRGNVQSGTRIYSTVGPPPHPPLMEVLHDTTSWDNGTTKSLPAEIACCISFEAAPIAGTPMRRLRGRVYMGPFNDRAIAAAAENIASRPDDTMQQTFVSAAKAFHADLITKSAEWVQVSKMRGAAGGTDGLAVASIVKVWCDDAWDTQRRRGDAATERTVVTV